MAAVYNAEGIFMYDDGQPSIDQMQYELARNGKPSPLDSAVNAIKNVAIHNNPLILRKQGIDLAGDIPRVAASGMAPFIAGITQPLVGMYNLATIANKMPGVLYRENVLGDPQSMQEAAEIRAGLPQNEQTGPNFNFEPLNRRVEAIGQAVAPQTPQGQAVLEGLSNVFSPLKLPMMGPGSGMPGTSRISPRPMFTPNDLRVVGAEATRVGRQIGEIPTDFANAQSGLQRIDPITNQPVLGARIQSGVNRFGDIMEQRRMQGLTPIPGLPAALQPETNMYAVRPQGSRLTTPTIPETARGYQPPIDPANDLFKEVVGLDPDQAQATPTLLHSLTRRTQFGNAPNPENATRAFRDFLGNKAKEMYPEATTTREATDMFNAMYYDNEARHTKENELFDEFLKTFMGQDKLPNAVPTEEMAKRHDAATEGLKNMWGKYLIKNLGTEGNPLVKMAAEKGLTYLPAEDVMRIAADEGYTTTQNRGKGGFPIQGTFAEPIANLKQEIEAIDLPLQNAANAEQTLGQAAHDAGVDPASVPEYLEARKNAVKLNKQKNELQKKLDNLTLASAYEAIEDASVKPAPAKAMLKEMHASERPFYPSLKEAAARDETGYKTSIGSLEYLGFVEAADKFYNDVLKGKIPADKAATYPVDKYIRENAEARIKVEQAAKANFEAHKNEVLANLKQTADALPADKKFGNVGVVELTKDTPINDANKEVAASTEALDICIGEGGGGSGTRNLFTGKKDPNRTPIVNLLTGEPNPNASRHTSTYVDGLQRGEQLPMFRDLETGMPIAALQFHRASSMQSNGQPMFNIGYASGARNGRIEAKYADGIRDYLNSRANDIAGIGDNLENNTGIFDTTNKPSLRKARTQAQVSEDQMKVVDWNSMPRFMTAEDVKQAVKDNVPTVVPQQSLALQEDIGQLQVALVDNIDFVVNEAIQNSNLDAPEELERRLGNVFSAMQGEYFPTLLSDPIPTLNRALEYLHYEIDRRSNNFSELSQEMATALQRYAEELEIARDDLVSQQQRAQAQVPQTVQQAHQMQPAEQLRQLIEPRLFAGNARVVNDALREYSGRLQNYAANQLQNGMSPVEIADNVRTKINEYRNTVLRGPTINTRDFTPDELGEYVSELRQMIDGVGQWLGEQQQPQTANLPTEVQQNIDRRNQYITNAYQTALTPNTGIDFVDTALSEFSDMLDSMATNMFGNGYNASEIAENLADRIHAEHMLLVTPDRINARGLTPNEADIIRQRLNNAYGNLNMLREMGVPAPEQDLEPLQELPVDFFEPDATHPANQRYTTQSTIDMARELFEQERTDANNFDIPSIEQSIYALREGLFDDERIRMLSPREQASFSEEVAFRLQNMLDDIRGRQAQPMNLNTAYNTAESYFNELLDDLGSDQRFADLDDDIRSTMVDEQQEALSDRLTGLSDDDFLHVMRRLRENRPIPNEGNQPPATDNVFGITGRALPTPVPAQPATAPYVPIARLISNMSDQAITADMSEYDRTSVQSMFETLTDTNSPEELRNIASLARSYAMGPWENFSDVQREWLARNIEEYIGDNPPPNTPPEGHKDGGRIRKYEDGGSTSDYGDENNAALDDFERMKLERWMSKRPEFHVPSKEFNDDTPDLERDDDIQVPKESTFDAKLQTPWEDDEWMMRNYIRKHYMETFAKGGTVQHIPSVEQMKNELMMRRA